MITIVPRIRALLFVLSTIVMLLNAAAAHSSDSVHGYDVYRLGFTDGAYRASDGFELSVAQFLSEQGLVAGYSVFYDGQNRAGFDTWLDDGSGPVRIGFTGADYLNPTTGFRNGGLRAMNQQGFAVGLSTRFSGTSGTGPVAWIDQGSGPTRLGFTGGVYQRSDGYETSDPRDINEQNQVIGNSRRYAGTSQIGIAGWLDDGSGPIPIGLRGPGYIGSNDYQYSSPTDLNDHGLAVGWSHNFNPGSSLRGQAAWMDDGTGPTRLGYYGPGYITVNGREDSMAWIVNNLGQASGYSRRYRSTGDDQLAWIDSGNGPTRIGLTGAGYQHAVSGKEVSLPRFINDQGQVIGTSSRFEGTNQNGTAVWMDDGTGAIRLGLTGIGFQNTATNWEGSQAKGLNEEGQVAGISFRYDGSTRRGQSGWFYDPLTDTTTELVFSTRNDGHAMTYVSALLEDGSVLGAYEVFAGALSQGHAIFSWDADNGMIDLGALATSPEDVDWAQFTSMRAASESGYVTGQGQINGQVLTEGPQFVETEGISAYLLKPIPEPSSLIMLAFAAPILIRRRA